MKFSQAYSIISTSPRSSQDLEDSRNLLPEQDHQSTKTTRLILGLPRNQVIFIFLAQLTLLTLTSLTSFHLGQTKISLTKCGLKLSTWSPALHSIQYHYQIFSGKFLAPSIYRGLPSPELEAAWKRIANDGLQSIRIPSSELWRLNKTASKEIVGFGKEQEEEIHDAEGFLEVFHQLHCLVRIFFFLILRREGVLMSVVFEE